MNTIQAAKDDANNLARLKRVAAAIEELDTAIIDAHPLIVSNWRGDLAKHQEGRLKDIANMIADLMRDIEPQMEALDKALKEWEALEDYGARALG